jgi:hypothetical protein
LSNQGNKAGQLSSSLLSLQQLSFSQVGHIDRKVGQIGRKVGHSRILSSIGKSLSIHFTLDIIIILLLLKEIF